MSNGGAGRGFRPATVAVVANPTDIPCGGEGGSGQHHQNAENRDTGTIQHSDSSSKNHLATIAGPPRLRRPRGAANLGWILLPLQWSPYRLLPYIGAYGHSAQGHEVDGARVMTTYPD